MSFWSSLASGLTSLIPGVGPFIAPLVGGAVGALSGGGGNKNAPGSTSLTQDPQIAKLMAGLNTPAAQDPATEQASRFYKTILGGGQDETSTLLGPDVTTILNQYDNASRAAAELGPRGAGRAAIQAETPFKKVGAYTQLLGKAKEGAASGLAQIGGAQTAAATARRGQNVSELGSLIGGKNSANELAFQQQKEKDAQYQKLGGGIGSFLTNLINGGNKKNNASTPTFFPSSPQSPYEGSDTGD